MKYLTAALAAACMMGGAQAALAKTPDIVVHPISTGPISTGMDSGKRENIVLRVRAPLDTSDPATMMALRKDATRAIERACNPGDRLNADVSPDWQCRREMAVNLENALRQLSYGG